MCRGRTMRIPFNRFSAAMAGDERGYADAVEAVGANGWYILGSEVLKFEADLATTWGVNHAIGVASGLDAIENFPVIRALAADTERRS